MKRSWLVQRLEKPRNYGQLKDNPFSFGGGLLNGGLSSEAMDLLREIFSFDYMGAAEFEFGAVPQALSGLVADIDKLTGFSFPIALSTVAKSWRDKSTGPVKGSSMIYVICRDVDRDEVHTRILGWAANSYNQDLKETTRLSSSLIPLDKWDEDIVGWLELDNGFFFFIDEEMYKKTAELFGVKL